MPVRRLEFSQKLIQELIISLQEIHRLSGWKGRGDRSPVPRSGVIRERDAEFLGETAGHERPASPAAREPAEEAAREARQGGGDQREKRNVDGPVVDRPLG